MIRKLFHFIVTVSLGTTGVCAAEQTSESSSYFSCINYDSYHGNKGKGVRVLVWDGFPDYKDGFGIGVHNRLKDKIPLELCEESKTIGSLDSRYFGAGHGMHVSGLIVDDKCGIAPQASLIPKNAAGLVNNTRPALFKTEAEEILNNDHGAVIINCSFELPISNNGCSYKYSNTNYRYDHKINENILKSLCRNHLVVYAAGNYNFEGDKGRIVPEEWISQELLTDENVQRHLFVVTNFDAFERKKAEDSNHFECYYSECDIMASRSKALQKVGIAAPGTKLLSTTINAELDDNGFLTGTSDRFETMSGTSQAAPLVSGLLACLLSDYPDRSISEIADVVREGCHRNGMFNNPAHFGAGVISFEGTYELARKRFEKP